MDLVSFETPDEYRHFAKIMFRGNIVLVIVGMLILRMINCTMHMYAFARIFVCT